MKYFFQLLLISCLAQPVFAQNLTGIWKGYFVSRDNEHYKLEFQLLNKKGAYAASGVSYSYLDVRFYGKATMTGNYLANSKNLRIKEIKTVEVKNYVGNSTCIMNYNLAYSISGKEEYLEGSYIGKGENPVDSSKSFWGDCGGGKVFLRRVLESDFYLEPFLKSKTPAAKPKTTAPTIPTVKKPATKQPDAIKTVPVTTKKPAATAPIKKPEVITTVPKTIQPVAKDSLQKNRPAIQLPIPTILKTRSNELVKTLVINNETVTVSLYDNGEIDDDTISVYLDRKKIVSSARLSTAPITLKFKMDDVNDDHELVMVAENLGRIPPNTSLMIVEAGDQRFEVRITSTEQKNAMVKFRYENQKTK